MIIAGTKWENMAILIVKYLHLPKKYPLFHWEIILIQERNPTNASADS